MEAVDPCARQARRIVDDAWQEISRTPFAQQLEGGTPARLPDLSVEECGRRSRVGRDLLGRIRQLDSASLPHDLALSLRLAEFRARAWSREEDWYWNLVDPRGTGSYGMFLPTAYCGGYIISFCHNMLMQFDFGDDRDCDHYLSLLNDYGRLVTQFGERTREQAKRGIRMPRAQVGKARALLARWAGEAPGIARVDPSRLERVRASPMAARIEDAIRRVIEPAYRDAFLVLDDDYFARAPEAVGIAQYDGGEALYVALTELHTTLDFPPDRVRSLALERLERIEGAIEKILTDAGFAGDPRGFERVLGENPDWRRDDAAGITAFFQHYIDRMDAHHDRLFAERPAAACTVAPLAPSLEASMSFGYYDPPRAARNEGIYFFNLSNLSRQPLHRVPALAYHELIPGHHLHFASQVENRTLHPLRANSFVNAYVEGWAEYAAELAGETGLYRNPVERYGRLVMDAFLTCRLVADTGMNLFGWSLEEGQAFLRRHSRLDEKEIGAEALRYACDRPAQVLAYKLGDTHLLDLRDRMRARLGRSFDIRRFHSALLETGAIPLADVAFHVEHRLGQIQSA